MTGEGGGRVVTSSGRPSTPAGATRRVGWRAGVRRARRAGRAGRERLLGRSRTLPVDQRQIALTFDDGPDPRYTPALLEVLTDLRVQATFFCVADQAAAHPDVMQLIIDGGHVVGSHGATHVAIPTLSHRELLADVRRSRRMLEDQLGCPVTIYRPAHGDLALRTAVVARAAGMRTWLWSVEPEDWRPGTTSDEIAERCNDVGAGDVIVLHDGLLEALAPEALDRSATLQALPAIVGSARAKGLELAVLPS